MHKQAVISRESMCDNAVRKQSVFLTRNWILLKLKVLELRMWSARRPGVATTTWGWLVNSKAWLTMSVDQHSERVSVVNGIRHWLRSVRYPVHANALSLPSYPFHQQRCNPSVPEASPGRETARRSDRPVPCMTSHARPHQLSIETPQLLSNFVRTKIIANVLLSDNCLHWRRK